MNDLSQPEDRYGMPGADATALYNLRLTFGHWYEIPRPLGRTWRAWRLGSGPLHRLEATSAADLAARLTDDLAGWDSETGG
jgi:hypothetical protein